MSKILIVEDTSEFLPRMIRAVASGDPAREVLVAENRTTALDLIGKHDFDVIISDIDLGPDDPQGGLEVLCTAKKKDPTTEIVMVTSHRTPEVNAKAMDFGAFTYLERTDETPPNFEKTLARTVREALAERAEGRGSAPE